MNQMRLSELKNEIMKGKSSANELICRTKETEGESPSRKRGVETTEKHWQRKWTRSWKEQLQEAWDLTTASLELQRRQQEARGAMSKQSYTKKTQDTMESSQGGFPVLCLLHLSGCLSMYLGWGIVPQCTYRSQRTICESKFVPLAMRVSETEFKSACLVAGKLTFWDICTAPTKEFSNSFR